VIRDRRYTRWLCLSNSRSAATNGATPAADAFAYLALHANGGIEAERIVVGPQTAHELKRGFHNQFVGLCEICCLCFGVLNRIVSTRINQARIEKKSQKTRKETRVPCDDIHAGMSII
jgi:hypothetical protein